MSVTIVSSPPATPKRVRGTPPTSTIHPSLADLKNLGMSNCHLWIKCLPPDLDGIEDFSAYAADNIDDSPGANDYPNSDDALIQFLSEIFTPEIIIPVTRQLAYTQSEQYALTPSYLLRKRCGDIAHLILQWMVDGMIDEWEQLGVIDDEMNDSAGGGSGGGKRPMSSDTEARGGRAAPTGSSSQDSIHQSSDPPDDRRPAGTHSDIVDQHGSHVPSLLKVETVALPEWPSPPRIMGSKRQHVRNTRSLIFADSLPCRPYSSNPWNGTQGKICYLFHGTRTRYLNDFKEYGISETFKPNELAAAPTFYVTNFIQAAYEHPILTHERVTGDTDKHVSVIVFEFDSNILLGLKPAPGEAMPFTSQSIDPHTPEEKRTFNSFCNSNRFRGLKIKAKIKEAQEKIFCENPPPYDIIIAPICIPNSQGFSQGIVPNIPGYHQRLLQVGFCSQKSRRYANSCLLKVFAEKRGNSGPGYDS